MRSLPGESDGTESLHPLYAGLQETATPPNVEELRVYLNRLVALEDFAGARDEAVALLPAGSVAEDGGVSNGEFDTPLDNLPFGWEIENVRGATTAVVTDGNENKVLRVQFHNTHVPFRHVSELLMLSPGVYRLSGRVRTIALNNERGLEWAVRCAGGEQTILGATPRVNGSINWSPFEAVFVVPSEQACSAQLLRLELPARVPSEQEISGEAWYDGLSVVSAPDALPTQ
jgi:hypothetical protein